MSGPWTPSSNGEAYFRCSHVRKDSEKGTADEGEVCNWPVFYIHIDDDGKFIFVCDDCGTRYPMNEAIRSVPGKLNRFIVKENHDG